MTSEVMEMLNKLNEACNGKFAEFNSAIAKGNDEVLNLGKVHEETKSEIAALSAKLADVVQKNTRFDAVPLFETSLGRKFTNSKKDEILSFRAGTISMDFKNAITGLDGLVQPDTQAMVQPPMQTIWVKDLIPRGSTESNMVEYPRLDSFTNAAAPVAEGAQKPESGIALANETAKVVTIAHWIPVPVQKLDDIPYLESLINTLLLYGLQLTEEAQILYGSGTGENMEGLITSAEAFDTSLLTKLGVTQAQRADVLRAAIQQVVDGSKLRASGIVLSPLDAASLELIKNANGNYLQMIQNGKIWNVPVIESPSITNDDFLVGAFNPGAMIFDRQIASVALSTEDRDNFIKNMVTLRADNREAMATFYAKAFVTGKFSTALP
jgi:HK97 family phage major capsid protein